MRGRGGAVRAGGGDRCRPDPRPSGREPVAPAGGDRPGCARGSCQPVSTGVPHPAGAGRGAAALPAAADLSRRLPDRTSRGPRERDSDCRSRSRGYHGHDRGSGRGHSTAAARPRIGAGGRIRRRHRAHRRGVSYVGADPGRCTAAHRHHPRRRESDQRRGFSHRVRTGLRGGGAAGHVHGRALASGRGRLRGYRVRARGGAGDRMGPEVYPGSGNPDPGLADHAVHRLHPRLGTRAVWGVGDGRDRRISGHSPRRPGPGSVEGERHHVLEDADLSSRIDALRPAWPRPAADRRTSVRYPHLAVAPGCGRGGGGRDDPDPADLGVGGVSVEPVRVPAPMARASGHRVERHAGRDLVGHRAQPAHDPQRADLR